MLVLTCRRTYKHVFIIFNISMLVLFCNGSYFGLFSFGFSFAAKKFMWQGILNYIF